MNLQPQALPLLAQAREAGVGDIPGLQKWLKQAARRGEQRVPALSSLVLAFNRLTAEPNLRQWLDWPTDRFESLPAGTLIFACPATTWARQQLLRAVWLAVRQLPGVRLVLHGCPWLTVDRPISGQMVTSNGPLLAESVQILVGSEPAAAAKLAALFLNQDPLLAEALEILSPNQAILAQRDDIRLISWPDKANSGDWVL
jgi:hypothetical protein